MAVANEVARVVMRNRILWFGGRWGRSGSDEFSNRELELTMRPLAPLIDQELAGVRGVVYSIDGIERTLVRRHLEENLARIYDHGIAAMLLAPSDHDIIHVQDKIQAAGLRKIAHVRTGTPFTTPDHEIAQLFVRHDARLGWSGKPIIHKPAELEISPTDELLLRRAFADTDNIRLEPLSGGKTAEVFRVHAQFEIRSLLVQTLPFFAKLGERSKVERELENYREYANFYVPFHLRPNIDERRTVLGSERGCLVGNFVELAQPLWVSVEEGSFSAPLNALFDTTLRGWWAQGFSSQSGPVRGGSVAGALGKDIFDDQRVREGHQARAIELGLKRAPTEIYECLCDRGSIESYYQAPFHGDLHPENIFVRNDDAILIDLGSARLGPIGGDPACLEVALVMDVRRSDLNWKPDEWRNDVDRLFAPDGFERAPLPVEGKSAWKHRVNAVRKVRTLAQAAQICETGYQSAIAMYLLRRSMFDAAKFDGAPRLERTKLREIDAYRRAYALVLADRLVGEDKRTRNAGTRPDASLSRLSRKPPRGEFSAGAARG